MKWSTATQMLSDVVITTHRDLVALAPQPLYLAKALSERGLSVELISNAPVAMRRRLSASNLSLTGPSDNLRSPRLRLAAIWFKSIKRLANAKIGVAFDLNTVWSIAFARRLHSFSTVLYWLEPFYGDYGARPSFSTSLGRRSLEKLLPPDALIDVDCKRVDISRQLCKQPASCFVIRNAPPLGFARKRKARTASAAIRLVYSGSITGLGAEGIEHMVRAVAISKKACTLSIFPAEGRSEANRLAAMICEYRVDDRVQIEDRVERDHLAEALARYDIGIVLYPVRPGQDNNSLMAAPNKLYEYLAAGLAILASNNETMQFVGRERLGWNIGGNRVEETAEFLNLLSPSDVESCCERAGRAFRERYNYESQAEPVLQWFVRQIEGNIDGNGCGDKFSY